jgi:hypothetical protein
MLTGILADITSSFSRLKTRKYDYDPDQRKDIRKSCGVNEGREERS